jgi:hypothetical protein
MIPPDKLPTFSDEGALGKKSAFQSLVARIKGYYHLQIEGQSINPSFDKRAWDEVHATV